MIRLRSPAAQARKFYVKSYGCQMNVYDSQRMADTLAREGLSETDTPEAADLIILNTCAYIREKVGRKSLFGAWPAARSQATGSGERQGPKVAVAVAGCVAQAEGEEIIRRAPVVDIVVVGSQSLLTGCPICAGHRPSAACTKVVDTEFP